MSATERESTREASSYAGTERSASPRRLPLPTLLEPQLPARDSTVEETPGGSVTFTWSVMEKEIRGFFPGQRLRTDFCLKLEGQTVGFFIMKSLPGTAAAISLSFDEIRLKLGSGRPRAESAPLEWEVCLSLAACGPLFTSRRSGFLLLPFTRNTKPQAGGRLR